MAKAIGAAFRNLRRAPAFTGLVVLTLALGIGATTAMFSVVDAVLISPLPFPNAHRVIEVWTYFKEGAARTPGSTSAVITTVRQERDLFDAVSAYQFGAGTLTGTAEPQMLSFASLSPDIFAIFPTAPVAGRLFTVDDTASSEAVILISERLWRKQFGGDSSAIGKIVMIDDVPQRVVGVLPQSFSFPESSSDAWRPLDVVSSNVRTRVQMVAMRRNGVTKEQVDDRLKALTAGLNESGALPAGQYLTTDVPVQVRAGRASATSLYVLLSAVAVLLLVACVNVSNLMLVRASIRRGELAIQSAMGASRSRLLGDAAIESLMLGLAGGALGLWVADGLLTVILSLAPDQMRMMWRTTGHLDLRAVLFAAVVTLGTCLLFGVVPAWRASRVDPVDALKQQSRAMAGGRDQWWQGALVTTQLALVVVLLAGAGLLWRSFERLNAVDLGFRFEGLSFVELQLTSPTYSTPGAALRFMQEVESRVETQLGAQAALMTQMPVRFSMFADAKPEAEGRQARSATTLTMASARVAPDFFQLFEIPIIQGRTFRDGDGATAVIVNELAARRFWGDESPVGKRFKIDENLPWGTVVGVTADVKTMGPQDAVGEGIEIYRALDPAGRQNFLTLAFTNANQSPALASRVRQIVWDVDPRMPILSSGAVNERIGESVSRQRFVLSLSSTFTLSALLIAAVGVYGVSAYWVTRRRRELAIRLAMGATPTGLIVSVLSRSARLAVVGIVIGLGIAMAGATVMKSMLFQTEPRDPITYASVAMLLAVVTIVACLGPAWRASRVDPMTTLRAE